MHASARWAVVSAENTHGSRRYSAAVCSTDYRPSGRCVHSRSDPGALRPRALASCCSRKPPGRACNPCSTRRQRRHLPGSAAGGCSGRRAGGRQRRTARRKLRRRSCCPCHAAGLDGIVIWGLHRDTSDIRAIGLPVISLGAIPTGPQRLDLRPDGALERATVGDWTVDREDLVLADDDGVLFVPLAVAADVFTLAETIRDAEARQAERMRGGISLRNQVQFDTYLAERQKTPSLSFRDHLREVGGAIEV